MINRSPETAIRNIFERAATSLSHSRDQLDKTRKALKKAVLRLSASVNNDDLEINEVLKELKASVDININLTTLDSQLDKLFVLTNNAEALNKTPEETGFYLSLKNTLTENPCSEFCLAIVNNFAERKLSDRDISLEILKLIDNAAPAQQEKSEQRVKQA